MHELKPKKVALVLGSFAAVMHAVWSALVAMGVAQSYMDFVMGLHFLRNPYTVQSFSFANALGLVFMAFVMGNVVGYVFATIWNRLHR